MNQYEYVHQRLPHQDKPMRKQGQSYSPSNIALCKYWGKRDPILNRPVTDSLSISLGHLGAMTTISVNNENDLYLVNDSIMTESTVFYNRLHQFLDLFRSNNAPHFTVQTHMNIPIASGIASSACGYAAVTEALNQLFSWDLDKRTLSQLSRLGSGSACRSHWSGFVHWFKGNLSDGSDCYAKPLDSNWQELRLAILLADSGAKSICSRQAMARCQQTSKDYANWSALTAQVMAQLHSAIKEKDFDKLGHYAQKHSEAMHALMAQASPAIHYDTNLTKKYKAQIADMQSRGMSVFYSQDAGPHLKLLFLDCDINTIIEAFPNGIVVNPWQAINHNNFTAEVLS